MAPLSRDQIAEFCRRTLDDPARGMADLERIGIAAGSEEIHALLARLLPETPDPDLALVHLERYCRDNPAPGEPDTLQMLLALFGYSPYLAESLINDPGFLPLLARARRQGAWGPEEYRGDLARWMRIRHDEDPWDALRAYRKRTNLRIALRDLQRVATLPEICREISCAADALIQCGLDLVMQELTERYGRPYAYDESGRTVDSTLTVIALGKLGGVELNYSSDIDLLFIYSSDGETSGVAGRPETQITNRDLFTRAAEGLARGLGRISAEGQVFRVDCGLRPGGRDGDLVTQLQGALVYYRTWAHPWERQALIKARPCAGDLELGARFLAQAETTIYAEEPDPALGEGIRGLKDRIDGELARRGESASHIKLGMGGIREIEFTVQALQLLHGGREPWIRTGSTLLAMHRLTDKGYLPVPVHGALSAAYVFLREVEHRIQLHRNLQLSILPSAPRDLRVLARAMGYHDAAGRREADALLSDLNAHRSAVRSTYDAVLGRLSQTRLEETRGPDPFLDPVSDGEIVARLSEAGIPQAATLLGGVQAISRLLSTGPWANATEVRRVFRRVTPVLLRELTQVHAPVRALRVLERYLASLGLEGERLGALLERREVIPPLVRLFAGSQLLSSTLLHRPGLVLEPGFDLAVARDRTLGEHVERILNGLDAEAWRDQPADFLRRYQRIQVLYIGLKDINRQSRPAAVGRALSDLAEAIVRTLVSRSARQCGWPVAAGGDLTGTPGFFVLALGKLGYREMDYASDLDLIFLYDHEGEEDARRHAEANRLARLVTEQLTSITREGSLYAVDTRLRPFGREGELAQPVGRLREYFGTTAGVWEMQSFLKARPLAGDLDLAWETSRAIEAFILERARSADLNRPIREMKERLEREAGTAGEARWDIKNGPGGLNTIHFVIQLLQLRHGIPSPPHKRTTRLLATLRAAGLLDEGAYRVLFTGFMFLRKLEHQLRLIHGRPLTRLPASRDALDEIAVSMGYTDEAQPAPGDRMLAELARHQERLETVWIRVVSVHSLCG